MPTQADEKAKDLYQSIMTEVMIRAYSINVAVATPTTIPQPLIREYCFLQLRMLCELIALGCLVAHGDITKSKNFQKAWEADKIIKQLEKLHANFYPRPINPTVVPPSRDFPGGITITDSTADWLKKEELIKLYARCGSILHKGRLRNLLTIKMNPEENAYQEPIMWGQKILNLLHAHMISRVGNHFHILASLRLIPPDQASIQVAIAENPQPK
jgi:hypothetical protein